MQGFLKSSIINRQSSIANGAGGLSLGNPVTNLSAALAIGPREHIAIVGAGGKTTLMFALAEELRAAGKRVVTSTTTKVWFREALAAPLVLFVETGPSWEEKVGRGLIEKGHVFIGQRSLDKGRKGGSPRKAYRLWASQQGDRRGRMWGSQCWAL